MRRVVVAPDSFKGTFTAAEVAAAMGRGLRSPDTGDPPVVDECPVADGGEGTAEVLAASLGGSYVPARARDPLGREIEAGYTLLGDGETAVVETAAASGLTLVSPEERDAVAASSTGTGDLIVAAARTGVRTILVAVGGTATTDGGRGALEAIGQAGGLGSPGLIVLADVETVFEDAAVLFAPQKGASAEQVRTLTARLAETADSLPRSPLGMPKTGAGGGIAGGLWSACGARLVSGAGYVLDALDFDQRLGRADAVVVGEGRLDRQSLDGKIVGNILNRALAAGKPCHAIVGSLGPDGDETRKAGFASVRIASSPEEIEAAAADLGAEV